MPETIVSKEKEEVQEIPEEESAKQPRIHKAKTGGLFQTVIIVAIMQVIMLAGAFFFVRLYLAPRLTGGGEAGKEIVKQEREAAKVYMIEDLVVNPAGTNGTRYLSASIGLEYAKAIKAEKTVAAPGVAGEGESSAGMGGKTPIIRDILIAILTSKTIEQLSSAEGKEMLRSEIMGKINSEIAPDTVYRVYFVDYVLQ